MTLTARWADVPPGTAPDGLHREMTLATSGDVRELVRRLSSPHASEAHLVHNDRPLQFSEWLGKDEVDHQVTVAVFGGFGYLEFIDNVHVEQLLGDPTSPEYHTMSSDYFNRGSGVSVETLILAVTEFLDTAQLPVQVAWREHDDWAALAQEPRATGTGSG